MADLFNRIGQPRWAESIRRLLGLEGWSSIESVAPEIVPVAIAVPDGPENAALRQERLAMGGLNAAGGVGTQAHVQLVNPAGSSILVILERVWVIQFAANGDVELRVGTGVLGAATQQAVTGWRDGRWGFASTRLPQAQIWTLASAATAGVTVGTYRVGPGAATGGAAISESIPQWWQLPMILSPGDSIHFRQVTANAQIQVGYQWRERICTTDELVV